MRTLAVLFLLSVAAPAFARTAASDSDCDQPGNQLEANACAADALQEADTGLNTVYRQVLDRHADDAVALEKIKAAQRLWIQLRDADLDARYPVGKGQDPRMLYGSMYPMIYAEHKATLTRTRTAYLRKEFLERGEYDL